MNCRNGTGHIVSIKIPIGLRTGPETLHWVATLWDRGGHAWTLSRYWHINSSAPQLPPLPTRARCSAMVRAFAHDVMGCRIDPLSYYSFQPVLHDWCNKGHGMCYPVCGMVHIKEPLLLIRKSSSCCDSGFPLSLSEWSSTTCLTPLCEVTECYKHTPPECPSRTWWRWGLRQHHRHAPCPAFSHWNININIYDTITLLVKTGMPNLNVLFNETITVYHQLLVIPYDKIILVKTGMNE